MFSRTCYFIREAIANIFNNGIMSFVTTFTIICCLIIMGSCCLLAINVQQIITDLDATGAQNVSDLPRPDINAVVVGYFLVRQMLQQPEAEDKAVALADGHHSDRLLKIGNCVMA